MDMCISSWNNFFKKSYKSRVAFSCIIILLKFKHDIDHIPANRSIYIPEITELPHLFTYSLSDKISTYIFLIYGSPGFFTHKQQIQAINYEGCGALYALTSGDRTAECGA